MAATLRIIPVLDLKGGLVVRARAGHRDEYNPIETPLAVGSDPVAVAEGLRSLYPFDAFYCADLDSIERRAPNAGAITRLSEMSDAPTIWLDAGFDRGRDIEAALSNPRIQVVLGTESQSDASLLSQFVENPRLILSLDFFTDGYRGPRELLERDALWPQTIIVMTLARVGVSAGPDFDRLGEIKARAGARKIIAAGGVRDSADIEMLSAMGIDGVLVATALHDGRLAPSKLVELQGGKADRRALPSHRL